MSQSISEGRLLGIEGQGLLIKSFRSVWRIPDGKNTAGAYNERPVSTPF